MSRPTLTQRTLKDLRALRHKKHRLLQGRYLVEGARLVLEALRSPVVIERILCTDEFARSTPWPAIEAQIRARDVSVTSITAGQAEFLSDTQHPQGIFAAIQLPSDAAPQEQAARPPLLIVDDIADPGNLGTILRTADWLGVPTVWASEGSADIFNPKVVRGGMGAHFHLANLWQGDLAGPARQLKERDIYILGATLDGVPIAQLALPGEAWALVVGSEARGLSPFWRERLDTTVTIPGSGKAESLNAAVAAGIILHYLMSTD